MQPEAPSTVVLVTGFAVLVLLGGVFMRLAARFIKVPATLPRAMGAAAANFLANAAIFTLLSLVGAMFAGFFLGAAANVIIIRRLFKVEWGQSFVIWLGYLFATIASMFAMQAI